MLCKRAHTVPRIETLSKPGPADSSRSVARDVKKDTAAIYNDTVGIKNDTAHILQEIARLHDRLPLESSPSSTSNLMLQRYLDDLSSYAGSTYDPASAEDVSFPQTISESEENVKDYSDKPIAVTVMSFIMYLPSAFLAAFLAILYGVNVPFRLNSRVSKVPLYWALGVMFTLTTIAAWAVFHRAAVKGRVNVRRYSGRWIEANGDVV